MTTTRDDVPIKFRFTLKRAPAPEMNQVVSLEKWRALFFKLGFIGEYPNEKIGYGNLSLRLHKKTFLITGSQTGHLAHLQGHHYTKVIECDPKKGSVTAEGMIPPSSESLTHHNLYEANPAVQCIFEIEHKELARSMASGPMQNVTFIIDGERIYALGASVDEAGKMLLDLYRKLAVRF